MKSKNAKVQPKIMLTCLVMLITAGTVFFSCKKEAVATAALKDDLSYITKMVEGKTLSGNIISESDEKQVMINCNNGRQYILIEKIPGLPTEDVNSMQSAVLITSKYGIIIQDVANDKVFLMANNDNESLQKFEEVKHLLNCNYVSTIVFGTTIVHSEKS